MTGLSVLYALLVICFGISHGYAHGVEWSRQTSGWWFSVGFLCATLGLHIMGGILGLPFNEAKDPSRSFALAGTGITSAGVVLSLLYLAQTGPYETLPQ